MDVNEGDVLAGKFKIERVIGRGGMGVVVAATHVHLGERVALKFLLPEALHSPEAVERFAREARAAVRIKSEHVARVSDVGTLDNGAPYMVMEFLDGIDLAEWLLRRGPLPIEQAVEFVLQACEALAEAHTLGIVHRDLKPGNLFVIERPDGALAVKVLDFGISKATGLGSSGASMTKTSVAMGSPLYMSPEQMQSAKDVDARGDIWALGVLLYELISARTPFPGETMAELVLKIVTGTPVPLAAVCPQSPPALEGVILKCLEKDRGRRYQTIGELAVALVDFAPRRSKTSVRRIANVMQRAGMSASALQVPASSEREEATPAGTAPQTMASWGQTNPPPNNRQRIVLIAATLMALPILAVGGIALVRANARTAAAGQTPVVLVPPVIAKPLVPQEPAVVLVPSADATPALSASGIAGASGAVPSAVPPIKQGHLPGKGTTIVPVVAATATSTATAQPAIPKIPIQTTGKNPLNIKIQ